MLGVTHVHAQQVTREQGGLVTTGTGLHLENDVAAIVRVTRNQQAAQLLLSYLQLLLQAGHLSGELRVLLGHLAGGLEVVLERGVLVVGGHDTGQLRVAAAHSSSRT